MKIVSVNKVVDRGGREGYRLKDGRNNGGVEEAEVCFRSPPLLGSSELTLNIYKHGGIMDSGLD